MDAVEYFMSQWAEERPELDVTPMATIGRLSRMAALIQERIDGVFAQHDLQSWEFDVLASLRRSGEPYSLTAGELDRTMMITSGTTTHRITRLEARGFVERVRDENDRRVVHVRLTDDGRRACDAVHGVHLDNERAILALMSDDDRVRLTDGLIALAEALGDAPPAPPRR